MQILGKKFWKFEKSLYLCSPKPFLRIGELSSVGSERLPYKQRVGGSNPSAPTLKIKHLQRCRCLFRLYTEHKRNTEFS